MRKLTIGVCFLFLFAFLFIEYKNNFSHFEVKQEIEKTAPSVEEVIQKTSIKKDPPDSNSYRGTWIGKSDNHFTRLQIHVNNDVVNGMVVTKNKETSEFHYASFTGMIQDNTIEGIFREETGNKGIVTIEDKGKQLVLKVDHSNEHTEEKGMAQGEYVLTKDDTNPLNEN